MSRLTHSARLFLAVSSIFLLGAVAGLVLDRTMLTPAHASAATGGGQHGGPGDHEAVLAELRAELRLSAPQSARVQEIFARHQGEIEAAWAQVHANLQHAIRGATTEMEAVLDSAQIERLHAWLAKRHGLSPSHGPR
jgi:hypothetical protein